MNTNSELENGFNVQAAVSRVHITIDQGDAEHLDYATATCEKCGWTTSLESPKDFTNKTQLKNVVRRHDCERPALTKVTNVVVSDASEKDGGGETLRCADHGTDIVNHVCGLCARAEGKIVHAETEEGDLVCGYQPTSDADADAVLSSTFAEDVTCPACNGQEQFVVVIDGPEDDAVVVELEHSNVFDNLESAAFVANHVWQDFGDDEMPKPRIYKLVEVEWESQFKVCYICGVITSMAIAKDVADWLDRMVESEDDEWPQDGGDARKAFSEWLDENLTNCKGPASNFLPDGRTVVCESCFADAGGQKSES